DGSRGPVRLTELEPLLPGFGFQFYGQPIHQIWVARDGYVSFGHDNPDPAGDLVPGPFDRNLVRGGTPPPPHAVMAFWDKMSTSSMGVCYELNGPRGAQSLRLAWTHACLTQPCGSDATVPAGPAACGGPCRPPACAPSRFPSAGRPRRTRRALPPRRRRARAGRRAAPTPASSRSARSTPGGGSPAARTWRRPRRV